MNLTRWPGTQAVSSWGEVGCQSWGQRGLIYSSVAGCWEQ